jgi:sugar phosphate isomerase/epimerase
MAHRSAHDLGPDDLVLSHFSLERFHPFPDRLDAAAAAGFAGIGLFTGDYLRLREEGHTPADLQTMVDDHGLCVAEIEVARGWGAADPAERERIEPVLWEMADTFAPRALQAIGPRGGTVEEAVTGFGRLCDEAAAHDLAVALEFLPFTDITTLTDARTIVQGAARPNGGLCLDLWHLERGSDDRASVADLAAELVITVQMSGGPAEPVDPGQDYKDDCLRNRRPPGSGDFDAVDFVRRLTELGVTGPWSVEVCDERAWGQPAASHVRNCADHLRAVLSAARSG